MASSARRVVIEFLGDDKSASSTARSVDGSTSKLGDTFKNVGKAAAVALAVVGAAVVAGGKYLYDHASQLEQMAMKADTVFGSQIGMVEAWAKKNAWAMGLSSREATGLAANFGDLLIPMGFTRKEAAKMSTDVVGLSGALSQWSGGTKSAAEVSEILSAAMLGETDGLKSLGIAISAADIKAQMLKDGTDKLTGSQQQQAEAQAIQTLIMEKSTDAQDAYAKGGSPLLSAQAKLSGMAKELRDKIAVGLVPAFVAVAEILVGSVVPALTRLGGFIASDLVPAVRSVGGFFVRWKEILGPFGAVLVGLALGIGAVSLATRVVAGVTRAWAAAQVVLNAVMAANPITLVVVALAAVAAAVVYAYLRFERFRNIVDKAFSVVKAVTKAAWGVIVDVFRAGVAVVRAVWDRFGSTIVSVAKRYWAIVKDVVKGYLDIVKGVIKVAVAVFKGDWSKAWDGIKDIVRAAWSIIRSVVSNGLGIVKDVMRSAWGIVKDIVRGAWDGIRDAVRGGADWLIEAIRSIPDRLRNMVSSWGSAGKALIGAFVDGMKNAAGVVTGIAGNVWDAVKSLINGAISKLNAALSFSIGLPGPDININTNIPYLGRGGIVTRPTLAVIGEAGPEAVIPLTGAHSPTVPQTSGGGGDIYLTVNLRAPDGKITQQELLRLKRRNGGLALGLA